MGMAGLVILASPLGESLCCVLGQDTLSTTQYWFNPGRSVPTLLLIVDWDVQNQTKQTNKIKSGILFNLISALCTKSFQNFFYSVLKSEVSDQLDEAR